MSADAGHTTDRVSRPVRYLEQGVQSGKASPSMGSCSTENTLKVPWASSLAKMPRPTLLSPAHEMHHVK